MTQMPDSIEFYFDPISPYAWLASRRVAYLADAANKRIVVRPVLFAGLLNAHGQKGPAEIPAKRKYVFRDVMRRAKMQGIEFTGPPHHPFNPLLALRLITAIQDEHQKLALAIALANAAWGDGLDISNIENVISIAEGSNLSAAWAKQAVQDPKVKQGLKTATQNAVDLGIFGVPTLRYGDELFWGNESFDTLLWHLQGNRLDDDFYKEVLARTASAQRKAGQ